MVRNDERREADDARGGRGERVAEEIFQSEAERDGAPTDEQG
jgi:hypothetical protein